MEPLKEDDIRPNDLIEGQKIKMTQDIGRLLSVRDKFVDAKCPACDCNNSYKKHEKYSLDYHECSQCQTLFMNPRPTPEILDWFYKGSLNYDYWNKFIFPASEESRRSKIFVPRVNRVLEFCEKYNIKKNSILEIGSGFGTFCLEMKSRNEFEKIIGVEPTPGLAETLRNKGIDVIEDVIENIQFEKDDRFDVVVSFEVIEHIFSPKKFIENAVKLLNKGGLFILSCPNGRGFDFTVLGEKCISMDHEHLNYFNPKSLNSLLELCGFEVLETITPGKLDAELVRNEVLKGTIDISSQLFLKQVLIEEWESKGEQFQQFLAEAGLSSHMWAIARKI